MAKRKRTCDNSEPKTAKSRTTSKQRTVHQRRSPSRAVLALLASVAPATANSTPLDFLYPSSAHPHASQRHSRENSFVPAKYVAGDDGQWRKAQLATLYGSTFCSSECSFANATASTSSSSPTVSESGAVSTGFELLDSLPLGWKPTKATTAKDHTTLILAMALVLAFAIIFCMIGCLFVRKSRRRKKYPGDVEVRGARRRRRRSRTDEAALVEKEIRHQSKLWARASARWKEHILRSVRHRRGARTFHRSRGTPTPTASSTLNPSRDSVDDPAAPSIHSRRSSISAARPDVPPQQHSPSRTSLVDSAVLNSEPTSPSMASPPAYIHPPRPDLLGPPSPVKSSISHVQSLSHMSSMYTMSNGSESALLAASSHSGHVATDDKARLAHLASLASAPTTFDQTTLPLGQGSSAPEWHDEAPHVFDAGPSRGSTSVAPPQPDSFLPSPPEKPKFYSDTLSDGNYEAETLGLVPLEHSSHDDLHSPSAPPFEESQLPSAPPALMVEDLASAPVFEEELDTVDEQDEREDIDLRDRGGFNGSAAEHSEQVSRREPLGQNHDRHPSPRGPPEYTARS